MRYSAIFFTLCLAYAYGDIYLHNPRGSNNRLDEETRNRNNAKRMFDSQNNDRGGYNAGSVFYYSGSVLRIEWTNQHSCQNPKANCDLILQYMCDDDLRDGASRKTIPTDQKQCRNFDCNKDTEYGMNENYQHYLQCYTRSRNKGLFIADQNLKNRERAINTRQNPNGQRYGYECPEERDYYPYWHPSPWKDIAVMTNDASRCTYYQQESANVKSRWYCYVPFKTLKTNFNKMIVPNNKEDCEKFTYPKNDPDGVKGVWKEQASHGLPAPDCRETEFSRDNHLGNGLGGQPNSYNWTIPDISHERCALRIRYNISTNDYDPYKTDSSVNAPNNNLPTKVDLSDKYGFGNADAAEDRGYVFEDNPDVKVFGDANFELQLAINTAQYGRTFQDRSHAFAIRSRPKNTEGKAIHNLNVRGKRGNIVQVYPSVEYDFIPNEMHVSAGDYVHIQWTGSNTNNRNNDGNGKQGTDRNNIVQLTSQNYPEGNGVQFGPEKTYGHYGNNYPELLNASQFLGLSRKDLESLAVMSPSHFGGEMSQLDDAGTYFDLGPREITQTGTYHYMSTRNNDFSNRDQKGRIMVFPYQILQSSIGIMGGQIELPSKKASVTVEQGTFSKLTSLRIEEWSQEQGDQRVSAAGGSMMFGDEYASNFLVVYPETQLADNGKKIMIKLDMKAEANEPQVYRTTSDNLKTWVSVPASFTDSQASFQVDRGGVYVIREHSGSYLYIIGIVIGVVALAVIVVATIIYFRRNPAKWNSLKQNMKYAERSVQNKV